MYLTMDKMKMSSPVLPPGFRFHPTDQELIIHYLQKKISSSSNPEVSIIADINIYKFNPWELPVKASFGENEWFFFSPRDRKYPNGARPNRAAASGYWKATGTDKPILSSNGSQCLGVKKTLVFYKGRPPKGTKTNWMMLEYRLLDDTHQLHRLRGSMRLDDWVLCRVRQKSSSPQPKEESYESTAWASSFPSNYLGSLQGQDMKVNMSSNTLREYDYLFQTCLNKAPLEQEETADQQGEGSPGSSVTAVDSAYQTSTVSSLKEALESIRKVLSINAIEDMSPVTPKKRLHASTASNAEKESIFQLSCPNIAASVPRNFSGFLI